MQQATIQQATRGDPKDNHVVDVHLSFTYPMTAFRVLIHLRVLTDPTGIKKRVITMCDIPGNSFIGTLPARESVFQLRHVSGLLLRNPQGGYVVPIESDGLHCIAPAGREVITAASNEGHTGGRRSFVLCPELANVRIAWDKRICGTLHPSFYTTRYIHAGEELMVNVDGECLASFLRKHNLVLSNPEGRRAVSGGVAQTTRWRCIEDADRNPFLVK